MSGSIPDPFLQPEANDPPGRTREFGWETAAAATENALVLMDDVQLLGARMRTNNRRTQSIDRRATAYASRLARHTARLLAHMPDAVPAIRPVRGTGASALHHYVLRHEQLQNPERLRMLVVSSDGRLRLCTVLVGQRSRLWDDYEVADPPVDMGLASVFEGLSTLIARIEGGVSAAETKTERHAKMVEGLIGNSEAVLANAGSRLAPVVEVAAPMEIDQIFGDVDVNEQAAHAAHDDSLTSHGFEHRISFDARK